MVSLAGFASVAGAGVAFGVGPFAPAVEGTHPAPPPANVLATDSVPNSTAHAKVIGGTSASKVVLPPIPKIEVGNLNGASLAELSQLTTRIQTEFVKASVSYEQAEAAVTQSRAQVTAAQKAATAASGKVDEARQVLAQQINQQMAGQGEGMLVIKALTDPNSSFEDVINADQSAQVVSQQQGVKTNAAIDVLNQARAAKAKADKTAADARLLQNRSEDILKALAGVAEQVGSAADVALADATDAAALAQAEQDARDEAARTAWQTYLADLQAAGIAAPEAVLLSDPNFLPPGLSPVMGTAGKPLSGVAQVTTPAGKVVVVLPSETIDAVTYALAQLGDTYVEGQTGEDTFDCGGLALAQWKAAGLTLPALPRRQWAVGRPVQKTDVQVGDLVFFGDKEIGLHGVGTYLGGNLVVTASAVNHQVGVQITDGDFAAVTRVPLAPGAFVRQPFPEATSKIKWKCGAPEFTGVGSMVGALTFPLPAGSYSLSAGFGKGGDRWAHNHTGQDFAAPTGTPVSAAAPGTVRVEHPRWAGNLIRVQHGDGMETLYAHLSAVDVKDGDVVKAGQKIGAVGTLGNSTGPHLHFEIRFAGQPVDPMPFLMGGSASGTGWGGFGNGLIPRTQLCDLTFGAGHVLRCDAAATLNALAAKFKADLGKPMCITDSYRSYAAQVRLYAQKPTLAAIPGTSNHGWGLAVDLCDGINTFSGPEHAWMKANAPAFGWLHPKWAEASGSKPEPWHWEFGNIS